jgi:hypothetical protein
MHIFVCMHVCSHLPLRIYIQIYTYTRIYTKTYTHVYLHIQGSTLTTLDEAFAPQCDLRSKTQNLKGNSSISQYLCNF